MIPPSQTTAQAFTPPYATTTTDPPQTFSPAGTTSSDSPTVTPGQATPPGQTTPRAETPSYSSTTTLPPQASSPATDISSAHPTLQPQTTSTSPVQTPFDLSTTATLPLQTSSPAQPTLLPQTSSPAETTSPSPTATTSNSTVHASSDLADAFRHDNPPASTTTLSASRRSSRGLPTGSSRLRPDGDTTHDSPFAAALQGSSDFRTQTSYSDQHSRQTTSSSVSFQYSVDRFFGSAGNTGPNDVVLMFEALKNSQAKALVWWQRLGTLLALMAMSFLLYNKLSVDFKSYHPTSRRIQIWNIAVACVLIALQLPFMSKLSVHWAAMWKHAATWSRRRWRIFIVAASIVLVQFVSLVLYLTSNVLLLPDCSVLTRYNTNVVLYALQLTMLTLIIVLLLIQAQNKVPPHCQMHVWFWRLCKRVWRKIRRIPPPPASPTPSSNPQLLMDLSIWRHWFKFLFCLVAEILVLTTAVCLKQNTSRFLATGNKFIEAHCEMAEALVPVYQNAAAYWCPDIQRFGIQPQSYDPDVTLESYYRRYKLLTVVNITSITEYCQHGVSFVDATCHELDAAVFPWMFYANMYVVFNLGFYRAELRKKALEYDLGDSQCAVALNNSMEFTEEHRGLLDRWDAQLQALYDLLSHAELVRGEAALYHAGVVGSRTVQQLAEMMRDMLIARASFTSRDAQVAQMLMRHALVGGWVLYVLYIFIALRGLSKLPYIPFRTGNVLIRWEVRTTFLLFFTMNLSWVLLWHVAEDRSAATAILGGVGVWMPLEIAKTFLAVELCVLYQPRLYSHLRNPLQVQLQRFAWTEAEKEHQKQRRKPDTQSTLSNCTSDGSLGQTLDSTSDGTPKSDPGSPICTSKDCHAAGLDQLPGSTKVVVGVPTFTSNESHGPMLDSAPGSCKMEAGVRTYTSHASHVPPVLGSPAGEPMFCFETTLKAYFWSCLAYFCHSTEEYSASMLELALSMSGYSRYEKIHDGRCQAAVVIGWNDDGMVIAFRGTATLRNALTDMQGWMKNIGNAAMLVDGGSQNSKGYLQRLTSFVTRAVCCTDLMDNGVHAGFWSSWQAVKGDVLCIISQALMTVKTTSHKFVVLLTGHSMGGALSVVAGPDIAKHVNRHMSACMMAVECNLCCYTFGAPRVTNTRFAQICNTVIPDTWHIINDQDIVPRLDSLTKLMVPYKRTGHQVFINGRGDMIVRPSFPERAMWTNPFMTKKSVKHHFLTDGGSGYAASLGSVIATQLRGEGFEDGELGMKQLMDANAALKQALLQFLPTAARQMGEEGDQLDVEMQIEQPTEMQTGKGNNQLDVEVQIEPPTELQTGGSGNVQPPDVKMQVCQATRIEMQEEDNHPDVVIKFDTRRELATVVEGC